MKISLPKPSAKNPGLPSKKEGLIKLLNVDFITAMPPVDLGGIACLGDFELKPKAEYQYLYLTPSTQKYEINTDGEVNSRLFKQKIFGTYPGDEIRSFEFIKKNINVGFVAIYKACDAEYSKIFGSPENPLWILPNFTDDSTGKKMDIPLEQNTADYTPILFYNDGQPIYVEDADHVKLFGPEFSQSFQ